MIAESLTGPAKRRMTAADLRAREAAEAGYEEFWRAPSVKEKIDAWMAEAFPDLPAMPRVPEDAPGDFSDADADLDSEEDVDRAAEILAGVDLDVGSGVDSETDSVFEPQTNVSVEDLMRAMENEGPAILVFDFVDTTAEKAVKEETVDLTADTD